MIVRGIACDECGVAAEDDKGRVIVRVRADDARREAIRQQGWRMVRGKDICATCKG